MTQEEFNQWGKDKGLETNWTLSQLDSLNYAQFLADFIPVKPYMSEKQLHQLILSAGAALWDDQTLLYLFLFPKNLPYKFWQPQILKSILLQENLDALQEYVNKVHSKSSMLIWDDLFMRFAIHETPYLKQLHLQLTPLVEKALNRKLHPTYCFLSLYGEEGICPPHRDQSNCQWTLDLCIKQDRPWNLFVEDSVFVMQENEALVYSGTDQIHWREKIHPKGHCYLVFFHFKEA